MNRNKRYEKNFKQARPADPFFFGGIAPEMA